VGERGGASERRDAACFVVGGGETSGAGYSTVLTALSDRGTCRGEKNLHVQVPIPTSCFARSELVLMSATRKREERRRHSFASEGTRLPHVPGVLPARALESHYLDTSSYDQETTASQILDLLGQRSHILNVRTEPSALE